MITTDSVSCVQITRPENFAAQFGNVVTTFNCEVPDTQGTWAEFLSNPDMTIGAVAAVGTLGAVAVALWQSWHAKETSKLARADAAKARGDAIAIAEQADALALKRDLRIKELERFEILPELMFAFADRVTAGTMAFEEATARLIFALQKYFVYLRQSNPDVAKAFSNAMDKLTLVTRIVNEHRNPKRQADGRPLYQHEELDEWTAKNPEFRSEVMDVTAAVGRALINYYDSSLTPLESMGRLNMLTKRLEKYFEPHLRIAQSKTQE